MRTKNRNILLALVAVFAFGALGVSSAAAALPEFTPGKSKFPVTLKLTDAHEVRFQAIEEGKIVCGGLEGSGSITGAKTASAQITFEGCRWEGEAGNYCTSTGLTAGDIRTEELPAVPVYTSKASKEVALDFNENTKKLEREEPTFAKFTCAGRAETIRGAVIVPITSVNVETSSFSLKLKQTEGKQLPTWFESEAGTKVTNILEGTWGYVYEQTGLGSPETVSLRTLNTVELKA